MPGVITDILFGKFLFHLLLSKRMFGGLKIAERKPLQKTPLLFQELEFIISGP